jgi:hypothetical protein
VVDIDLPTLGPHMAFREVDMDLRVGGKGGNQISLMQ